MDDSIKKYLQDICIAIDEIDSFFAGRSRRFDEFCSDLLLRREIERDIEVIGEAVNRILKSDDQVKITNARKIVDARNYISHGYDSLSEDILWSIVINHIPVLRKEVSDLLAS